jgi:hypothetical protein
MTPAVSVSTPNLIPITQSLSAQSKNSSMTRLIFLNANIVLPSAMARNAKMVQDVGTSTTMNCERSISARGRSADSA